MLEVFTYERGRKWLRKICDCIIRLSKVKYIFTDVNLDFVKDSKGDRLYTTKKR